MYFGFSHLINYLMCSSEKYSRKSKEAVLKIPDNRILSESDVPTAEDVKIGTAGSIAYIAAMKKISVQEAAQLTATNGLSFLRALNR